MAACRSCSAEIFWAQTVKGKRIPVDAAPAEDGNVELIGRDLDSGLPLAAVHPPGQDIVMAAERFRSHFATCPNAAAHRRSA